MVICYSILSWLSGCSSHRVKTLQEPRGGIHRRPTYSQLHHVLVIKYLELPAQTTLNLRLGFESSHYKDTLPLKRTIVGQTASWCTKRNYSSLRTTEWYIYSAERKHWHFIIPYSAKISFKMKTKNKDNF